MGLISRTRNYLGSVWSAISNVIENRSVLSEYVRAARTSFNIESTTGVNVTEDSALRLSAVYASIVTIAQTTATLPKRCYDAKGNQVTQHPVLELLTYEPNGYQTPFGMTQARFGGLLGWGNSYTEIEWGYNVRPERMITHHPSNVTPFINDAGELMYRVHDRDGQRDLDRSQMLHAAGWSPDGIVGWSPIKTHANSVGIGLKWDEIVAKMLKNKGVPAMVVKSEKALPDATYNELVNRLKASVSGANIFNPLVLDGGMDIAFGQIPYEEAMLVTGRKFEGQNISGRIYRIPPRLAGYDDPAKLDEVDRQFVKYCLLPHVRLDEDEMERKLFMRRERGQFSIRYDFRGLMRTDMGARYEAYKTGILSGFLSREEVRAWEDLEPREDDPTIRDLLMPQSIFGKPTLDNNGTTGVFQTGAQPTAQPTAGPPQTAATAGTRSVDPRLAMLVARTLHGLAEREQRSLAKIVDQSNSEETSRFYESHIEHVMTRLDGVIDEAGRSTIRSMLDRHRDVCLTQGGAELRAALPSFVDDYQRLATELL